MRLSSRGAGVDVRAFAWYRSPRANNVVRLTADDVGFDAVSARMMGTVALVAWVPVRRATKLDPIATLRVE